MMMSAMTVTARGIAGTAALALLGVGVVAGCSSGGSATVFTAGNPACGQDVSTNAFKDTVERVGGLRTDDYTVTFARGTQAGVVVLVEGDAERAFEDLGAYPGVAVVAKVSDVEDPGTISGFAQVQQIVDDACGA